jgi:DDE superfamily endonuclease
VAAGLLVFCRAWDADALGLAVARLIVKYLTDPGAPVVAAIDGTFFQRWGKKVFQARWAYDGSARGGKKLAFGNTRVIAAIVVRLGFRSSPVALPVLFRLWRGKGTPSQVTLAGEMMSLLVAAFPDRKVHGTGDAAFHGGPLVIEDATWTTRLPASAVLYGPKPPPTGKRGRPRAKGGRPGTCAEIAATADWQEITVNCYGQLVTLQAATADCLWYGSFKHAPGCLVLTREPGSNKPCDLGIFSLHTAASPARLIERYSWRRAIEPSNAAGKQLTGAGDAHSRTQRAVERAVPFAFLVQSLIIVWYAIAGYAPADVDDRRLRCPWYRTKTSPSLADMITKLRAEFTAAAGISGIPPAHRPHNQIPGNHVTCDATAA